MPFRFMKGTYFIPRTLTVLVLVPMLRDFDVGSGLVPGEKVMRDSQLMLVTVVSHLNDPGRSRIDR